MIPEYALNTEDVRHMMLDRMETHLTVKTEGYRCSTGQTFNLLLKAVAEGSSVEAVCADSCGAVDSNRLREQVNAALPVNELRQQETEMKAALQAAIPPGMPRGDRMFSAATPGSNCTRRWRSSATGSSRCSP